MATLISSANGQNWTTANTWKTVDTTSLLDGSAQTAEAGNTALTTSAVASSAFTPGAITIDGIAVHLASVAGATGTITVALETGGSAVAATSVTQNIATLPLCDTTAINGGWVLFQFAAFTLTAATAYKVRALVSSGASAVNLYRDATAGNWARMLRRSTNVGAAAPTTGDVVYVMGQLTGTAGTTSYTVTMDGTSTNQLGGISIAAYGTLAYGIASGQSYYLKTIGNQASTPGVIVYGGGTLQMGTSGGAMDSTSTAVLELNAGSDGQYGLTVKNGGTLTTYGATVNTIATFLAADVAANAASFTTSVSTGWASGDVVAIASTTRTAGDTEQITLGTVTGTTCTVSVGGGTGANTVKNAHSGTGATAGEVIHLSRNVKIRNASASFASYVDLKATSTVSCTYTEFSNLGANATNQWGIVVEATSGTCTIDHCAIHDGRNSGVAVTGASGSITFTNNTLYNLNNLNTGSQSALNVSATSGAHTLSGNYLLGSWGSTVAAWQCGDLASSYTNNTVAGCTTPSSVAALELTETNGALGLGTFSGNVVHSCSHYGLRWAANGMSGTLASCTIWRNNDLGLEVAQAPLLLTLLSCTFFGNVGAHVRANTWGGELILDACTLDGGSTFVCANGLQATAGTGGTLALRSCTFGASSVHSTADLALASGAMHQLYAWNTTLGSGTQVSFAATTANPSACVRAHKLGGSATSYKCWYPFGTIQASQSTRHTASGYAWQLTPSSATFALRLPGPGTMDTFKIPVTANTTVSLSVWMQKDSSYNGTAPTLTIVGGVIAGVGSPGTDITTTATLSANTWAQVTSSAVTPSEDGALEVYISVNGTAGSVYVDDVALS